jgi:hypothetical protein
MIQEEVRKSAKHSVAFLLSHSLRIVNVHGIRKKNRFMGRRLRSLLPPATRFEAWVAIHEAKRTGVQHTAMVRTKTRLWRMEVTPVYPDRLTVVAWLFLGSEAAGPRAAVLCTILAGAKRHRIEPWAYVRELLLRLHADDPQLEKMLPDRWAAAHPEAVLTHRLDESRAKAARTRARRAYRRARSR